MRRGGVGATQVQTFSAGNSQQALATRRYTCPTPAYRTLCRSAHFRSDDARISIHMANHPLLPSAQERIEDGEHSRRSMDSGCLSARHCVWFSPIRLDFVALCWCAGVNGKAVAIIKRKA